MIACVLYFFTISAPCALASARGRTFESALPLSLFTMLILQYIAGLAGLLPYGALAALLLGFACAALALVRLIRKRVSAKAFIGNFCTPAFVAFALLFAIAVVCNRDRALYHGDEFSQWAYSVKAMAYTNDFATNPAAAAPYASYPPGISLLQYFLQRLNQLFSGVVYKEWLLAVPYQTTAFALLISAVGRRICWKNALLMIPLLAVTVALPAVLYPLYYESIFPDPLIGILAGFLLSSVWCAKRYDALTCATVCTGLFVLTLLKDAALFFAIVCLAALLIDLGRAEKRARLWTRVCAVSAVVTAKASWALHVAARGVPIRFSETAPLSLLPGIITGAETGWRRTAYVSFRKAFFEKRVALGADAFTAMGKDIPAWQFYVSFFALSAVLFFALYAAAHRGGKTNAPERRRKNRIAVAVTIGFFVYWLGLLGLYTLKFVEFEAVALYCYERYISIPFLMLGTLLLAAFAEANTGKLRLVWATLLAAAVLAITPLHCVYPYLTRRAARGSAEMLEPQRAIAARVERVLSPGDRLYLLAQDSDGEGLAQKYLLFPRIVTGGAIGTPMYEGDPWTKDITLAEWQNTLKQGYDYVLLSHVDEAFVARCGGAFYEPDTIGDGALYSVDSDNGMLTLVTAQ